MSISLGVQDKENVHVSDDHNLIVIPGLNKTLLWWSLFCQRSGNMPYMHEHAHTVTHWPLIYLLILLSWTSMIGWVTFVIPSARFWLIETPMPRAWDRLLVPPPKTGNDTWYEIHRHSRCLSIMQSWTTNTEMKSVAPSDLSPLSSAVWPNLRQFAGSHRPT